MHRIVLPLLFCSVAAAQTAATKGTILQPSGDATLTNIVVGSAVAPDGTFGCTAEVYLVKGDGSAPPRKLTGFDESNRTPGATSVSISPDGAHAAAIAACLLSLRSLCLRGESLQLRGIAAMCEQASGPRS